MQRGSGWNTMARQNKISSSVTANRTSKYLNKKVIIDGHKFDSKKESLRYLELKQLEASGEIKLLKMQYPIILFEKSKYGRAIKYVADFTYIKDGQLVVEDVKSAFTRKNPLYRLKKRIVAEKYDIEIQEV